MQLLQKDGNDIQIREFIANLSNKSVLLTSTFYEALLDYHKKLANYIQAKSIYQPTSNNYRAAKSLRDQSLAALQNIIVLPRDIADQLPSSLLGIEILQNTAQLEISKTSYDQEFLDESEKLRAGIIKSAKMSPKYIELEAKSQSLLQIMAEYDKVIEKVRIDSAKGFSGWRYLSSKSMCNDFPLWLLIVLAIPCHYLLRIAA